MNSAPGHLFVLRGDLTRFACDHWLLPADANFALGSPWREVLSWYVPASSEAQAGSHPGDFRASLLPHAPEGWANGEARVLRLPPQWRHPRYGDGADLAIRPEPWLTNVGGNLTTPASWFASGVEEFLQCVWTALQEQGESRFRVFRNRKGEEARGRPLIALPLVGTGKGGGAARAGEILDALMPVLDRFRKLGMDIALMTYGAICHSAAQTARHRYQRRQGDGFDWWPELDDRLRTAANCLHEHLSSGNLALFLGSGANQDSGLPDWWGLLQQLLAGLHPTHRLTGAEQQEFDRLDYLGQAAILDQRFQEQEAAKGATALQQAICGVLSPTRYRHYTLTHALLASLPIREVLTTNYNLLFQWAWERALAEPGPATGPVLLRILPYDSLDPGGRWLLCMHGHLNHPEDIVLTQEDFLGYDARRSALVGLVQGVMLTRHMLFLGSSLSDPNLRRIAYSVRQVLPATREHPQSTSLPLGQAPLQQRLLGNVVELVPMDAHTPEVQFTPRHHVESNRRREIFLDCLLARADDGAHLLDPGFDALLEKEDRELALALQDLCRRSSRRGPLASRLQDFLAQLGSGCQGAAEEVH